MIIFCSLFIFIIYLTYFKLLKNIQINKEHSFEHESKSIIELKTYLYHLTNTINDITEQYKQFQENNIIKQDHNLLNRFNSKIHAMETIQITEKNIIRRQIEQNRKQGIKQESLENRIKIMENTLNTLVEQNIKYSQNFNKIFLKIEDSTENIIPSAINQTEEDSVVVNDSYDNDSYDDTDTEIYFKNLESFY